MLELFNFFGHCFIVCDINFFYFYLCRRFFCNSGRMVFSIIKRCPHALPMLLLLGGILCLTGFEWSSFEAPYVSEEEVIGLLNRIGMQYSFIRSPLGRFLWSG